MKEFILIFEQIVDKQQLVRKISIGFNQISFESKNQLDLFTNYKIFQKETNLSKAIINIHEKYGKNSLLKGIDLSKNATQQQRNNQIGGHKSG